MKRAGHPPGDGLASSLRPAAPGLVPAPSRRSAEHGATLWQRSAEYGVTPSLRSAEHGSTPSECSAEHGFTPSKRSAEHGFTPSERSAEHGFTLVELTVALLIFGLIAAAGVGLLAFSVRAQAAAGERLGEVAALRRTDALLSADLAQIVPRITRDTSGAPTGAFAGGSGNEGELALGLVRRGWSNPDARPRSSLQKVEYRLAGDRLERRSYPLLDGAAAGAPAVLLRRVRSLKLRYRLAGAWTDRWDTTRPLALPGAVEATIDLEGTGPVRMLFLSGTGYE